MLACALVPVEQQARAQATTEGALKGAFIYNFAKFTEWPSDALQSGAPLVACVAGDPAVARALTKYASNHLIDGHPIVVAIRTADGVAGCHLLYLSAASARAVGEAMASFADAPILTISDVDEFARAGGIAQFFVEGGKMRFKVNLRSVKRARLQLSSRLLSLAELVHD